MDLKNFTIKEIHQGLMKKKFSALELCQAYLDRIQEKDKKIQAFLTLSEDLAFSQAKEVDEMIFSGQKIPLLAGVPCAIKDNILVKNIKCTAGSKILENYIAPYDATCVEKLKNQKAVILGKTNLDEFAMGSSTENSAFGSTKNPIDLERVPGGSSGGSAAALAANFCCYSLGSDTGGSIRQPASFCGVVGVKPTYGAISRYGLIAFASSLDQIGPITKNVEDAKIVFDVINGWDEMDSTSVAQNSKLKTKNSKLKIQNIKIGIPKEYFVKSIDSEVKKVIEKAIKKFEEIGIKVEEINLPHTEYALPCYYIIASSEVSANLARYDGIKYGLSKVKSQNCISPRRPSAQRTDPLSKTKNLLDVYLENRKEGFGPETRRRIMLGTYALSTGYYEAYYLRALKVRTLIREDFEKAFQKVDFIFTPVSPTPAFKLKEKITDPLKMYLSDIFTIAVNLAGLPALSLPIGKVGVLPVGLQIIGRYFEEEKIFQIAQSLKENVCF